jgi:G3E family GTPase
LKLYRALAGKFVLLQDELEDESDTSSTSDTETSSPGASDDTSEEDEGKFLDTRDILANKKACAYFSGLHRSKGIFWLATRPDQMGSWSTAGAMLTLGSEMPWFCTVPQDEWMADEDTMRNIQADFEGEWGDRRQELVMIGEKLDVEGLTKCFDDCLLSRAEMRKWERIMHDKMTSKVERDEKLQASWDDGYWTEWGIVEDEEEDGP